MDNFVGANTETEITAESQEQEAKTYTAEEVAKLIQTEADRRTTEEGI